MLPLDFTNSPGNIHQISIDPILLYQIKSTHSSNSADLSRLAKHVSRLAAHAHRSSVCLLDLQLLLNGHAPALLKYYKNQGGLGLGLAWDGTKC